MSTGSPDHIADAFPPLPPSVIATDQHEPADLAANRAREARRLSVLTDAQRIFSLHVPDPEALFHELALWTAALFDADCIVRLISTDREWLEPAAVVFGTAEATRFTWEILDSSWHRVSDGMNGLVVQRGEAVLLAKTSGVELDDVALREYRPHLERIGVASLLIAPLRARGELLGTISLSRSRAGHPFTEADRAFLQEIADHSALIIDNALLLVRARASERREQVVNEVSARLVSCGSAREIADVVRQTLGDGFASACRLTLPGIGVEADDADGAGDADSAARDLRAAVEAASDSGRGILIGAASDGDLSPGPARHRSLSAIGQGNAVIAAAPISVGDSVAGAIAISRAAAPLFTREDLSALEEIARRVGSAIDAVDLEASLRRELRERRAVERELRRSEERLLLAMDAAQMATWEVDFETESVSWSPNAAMVLGVEAGQAPRTWGDLLELVHEDDRERMRTARQRAIAETGPVAVDYRIVAAGGASRWAMSRARAQAGPDGEATHLVGIHLDIDDRKRAEASRERLTRLIESSQELVAVTAPDGELVYLNAAGRRLLEIGDGDVSGIKVQEIIDLPPHLLPAGGGELAQTETWSGETRLRVDAGREPIEIDAALFPIHEAAGEAPGLAVIARDVRERIEWERQRQAFLGSLAHDLRNPITTIKAQAQLLQRRVEREPRLEPGRLLPGLGAIDASARVLTTMLDELDDLGRLRIGEPLALRTAPTDLVALVRAAIAEPSLGARGHQVTILPDAPTIAGVWDAARLRRVFDNLLSNAIKYSEPGSTVAVEMSRVSIAGGAWAVVQVRDEGIGIPAADLPYIFERFRRGRNVHPGVGGSGIGLTGVKQLIAQHGGMIEVTSVEGAGSTFTVRLPLDSAEAGSDGGSGY